LFSLHIGKFVSENVIKIAEGNCLQTTCTNGNMSWPPFSKLISSRHNIYPV